LTDVPDGANSYLWTDANDDGAMQGDEIEFFEHGTGLNDCWIAEDLTIVWSAGGDGKHSVYELTPEWEDGVPHYPDVRPSDPVGGTSLGRSGGTSSRGRGTFRDSDGNYYAHYRDRGERGDRHGAGWPTRWAGKNRLFRLDADGNEAWKIGRHAIHGGLGDHTVDTPPGYMHIPTGIVGEVQDTIAVCDRVETPGMIWTKDGLYAGSLFDSRADDGLPPMVYHWWRTPEGEEAITATDNAAEGTLVEYEDGGLWFAPGRQGSPVYRVRGWDGWSRDEGTVSVDEPPHAAAEGEGLNAAYFDSPALDGSPATERTDARVWGGVGRGSDGHSSVADGKKPVLNWTDGVDAVGKPTEFSVRWTGEVEAQLTEPFTFSTYQRGGVRLWIDGEQLIFGWNESRNRWETDPIPLTAGERVPVQLDFYTTRDPPACSLNWESPTQERERIPTDYLYPTSADVRTQPDARSATNRINPTTFDDTSDWFSARGDTIRVFGHYDSTQGGWIGYRRLDFGDGVSGIRIRARTNWGPPDIELRVGGPEGQPIGHVGGPKSTNGEYTMLEGEVDSISGVQDLYMVDLSKSGGQGLWMDWFTFE
jgi:hypothetical protein